MINSTQLSWKQQPFLTTLFTLKNVSAKSIGGQFNNIDTVQGVQSKILISMEENESSSIVKNVSNMF